MATKIVTKNSSTASAVPTASDLVQGELAVNVADKRLFTEDNGGAIVELGTNPSTIDINAGTIDGTAIGASSASTGAFTTLTATGAFTSRGIDDNADATAITIDSSENVGIGTSSPAYELDVKSSGEADIRIDSATGNDGALRFAENGTNVFTMYHDAANSALAFYDNANTSERLRIDASGNVGIGNSSPSSFNYLSTSPHLVVGGGSSDAGVTFYSSTNGYGRLAFADGTDSTEQYRGLIQYYHSDNSMQFYTGSDERMRIDSSGNLLVGQSSTVTPGLSNTTTGLSLTNNGYIFASKADDNVAWFNRNTSDGSIISLRKDGSTVGSIGAKDGDLYIGTNDTALRFYDDGNFIYPVSTVTGTSRDNAIDLGYSSGRFKDLYLSGGVYLGGTGAANKLDDYEEGTFTPTSPDVTLTSPYSTSRYRKIGSLVYVTYDFVVPVTSATQFLKVNTPFAAVDYGSGSLGWTDSSTDLLVHVNTSGVSFRKNDGSGDYRYADLSGKRFIFTVLFTTTA